MPLQVIMAQYGTIQNEPVERPEEPKSKLARKSPGSGRISYFDNFLDTPAASLQLLIVLRFVQAVGGSLAG